MKYFNTPNEFDLKGLEVFGLSVKVTKDPIGYFGSGLKYAIAQAVSHGFTFKIRCGSKIHTLRAKPEIYRDEETMRIYRGNKALPFNTDHGKDWEPWMCYRELIANTLDEGGTEDDHDTGQLCCMWTDAWDEVPTPLLTGTPLWKNTQVEIYEGPSKYIYYKGFRVKEANCANTYNLICDLRLTEDRTLRSSGDARYYIADALNECPHEHMVLPYILIDPELYENLCYPEKLTPTIRGFAKPYLDDYEKLRKVVRNLFDVKTKKPVTLNSVEVAMLERAHRFVPLKITRPIQVVRTLGDNIRGLYENDTIFISRAAFCDTRMLAAVLYEEQLHADTGCYDETRQMQNQLIGQIIDMQAQILGEEL